MPNFSISSSDSNALDKELQSIYTLIKPTIHQTPLLELNTLSQLINGQVLVKPESLQETGAFKFRGALYRLMQLTENEKKQGVAAYSSGNFARGLAHAGKILGISVHLVMPFDAPANKIESVEQLGAEVSLCYESIPSREDAASMMASSLAKENNHVLLHPFDDPVLIKGQATVGVELLHQLQKRNFHCDSLLCPSGGGSLVSGCSMTFSPEKTGTCVYAVEIEHFDGMNQSILEQKYSRATGHGTSCCDALLALSPGKATFSVAVQNGVKGLAVSEACLGQALRLAFNELKLVLEPSGAIAIAAILERPDLFQGQTVALIASGGNVDFDTFVQLIQRG